MNDQSLDLARFADVAGGVMPGVPVADEATDDEADAKIIKKWLNEIDQDIEFHKPAFKRMDEDIQQANGYCWPDQTEDDERYSANITQRVVRQRVAALYAKNPTIVTKRIERMDFAIWDGDVATLDAAASRVMAAMQSGMPANPMDMQLMADVKRGWDRRKFLDRLARTLQLLMEAQLRNQERNFKREMKDMLRRQEITGVGWIKLDYIREMDVDPAVESRIDSLGNRIAAIEAQKMQVADNYGGELDLELKRLQDMQESLAKQRYIMRREGIVFRFPKSDAIIPDRKCSRLEGFLGARYVTEWFSLSDDDIKRIYKVDICKDADDAAPTTINSGWRLMQNQSARPKNLARPAENRDVFLVYDLDSGTCFTIARGYGKYLVRPKEPPVKVEQFFPYYLMAFNQMENNKSIWMNGTVRLMRPMQQEYNRAKEALRNHRIAMAPLYATGTGALSEEDKKNFKGHGPHDCIELDNLPEGQSIDSKLMQVKKHPIDPNVYETATIIDDVSKVTGVSASGMSIIKGGTATESTIAEDSHQSDVGSAADDQDDIMSMMMRDAGHTLLINMEPETVKKLVGVGAVWPDFPDDDIIQDLYLDIAAGSSGRPNAAADSANAQRLMPFLLQTPGVNPTWISKKMIRLIDPNVNLEDATLEGNPAILAMNQMLTSAAAAPAPQLSTGDPATDPAAQAGAGAINPPGMVKPGVDQPAGMTGPDRGNTQRAGGMIGQMLGRLRGG